MKKTFASIGLLLILSTTTVMADMIPEGEKVIPACAKLINADNFEYTTFIAAIYSEGSNHSSTPEKIETVFSDSCINTGKYQSAKFFAVNSSSYTEEIIYEGGAPYDPTTDIDAYPLAIGNGIETINTHDEYVDITNASTTLTREYIIGGIDNSKRVFYVNHVANTTDVMTEDLVPTNPAPENLDNAIDIETPIFTDVSKYDTNAKSILDLKRTGVVEGYEDGTYKPDTLINRAEFTKIVVGAYFPETQDCAMTTPTFTFSDIVMDSWYADFVCIAFTNNIIAGYPDGTFKPDQNINFAEAAKIVSIIGNYSEETDSNPWYTPYIEALATYQAIPMTITAQDQLITRGEMAEMIYRVSNNITNLPSKQYDNRMDMIWSETE